MEHKLIPSSQERVDKAYEALNKLKVVNSPEMFISIYNSGIISSNNDLVKDTAKAITFAYVNLKMFNNKIIIRTEEEVAFDTSIEILKAWRLVSTLKRVALQMLDESFSPDTKLLFLDNKPGILHYEGGDNDSELIVSYWLRERLFQANSNLVNNIFLGKYVYEYDSEEQILGLKLSDVVDLDDSFILETKQHLLNKTFEVGDPNFNPMNFAEDYQE